MVPDVLPCYIVCDVSFSMNDHLDEVNAGMREFRGVVHAERRPAAQVRLCVVVFADRPLVMRPLTPALDPAEPIRPRQESGSDFGAALTLVRTVIERDVEVLKAQRVGVRRPVLFFVSDGRATDQTWPEALERLTGTASCPEMVAFGLGVVDQQVLDRIGTSRVFLGRDGVRLGIALASSVARTVLRPDHV
ncbi:VWA domain-containing protein [Lentzea sp. NPDC060358]|uniref:vWA domain-containing protein n=1 Tax=Lentzea sp. NPDC060358 TaxID=3347103 RepID=UPI00364A061A